MIKKEPDALRAFRSDKNKTPITGIAVTALCFYGNRPEDRNPGASSCGTSAAFRRIHGTSSSSVVPPFHRFLW